jgi:hypothetical protein
MKPFLLLLTWLLLGTAAFTQDTELKKPTHAIKVPDFSAAGVKQFYTRYSEHLLKCIEAIRQKDDVKVAALFKDPGEKLVKEEKQLVAKLFKDPVEKQKYIQFAEQASPYVKEVERYYEKMQGKN